MHERIGRLACPKCNNDGGVKGLRYLEPVHYYSIATVEEGKLWLEPPAVSLEPLGGVPLFECGACQHRWPVPEWVFRNIRRLVSCKPCSEAGGADRAVFHQGPECPPSHSTKRDSEDLLSSVERRFCDFERFKKDMVRIDYGDFITFLSKPCESIAIFRGRKDFQGIFPLELKYWMHGIFQGGYANPNIRDVRNNSIRGLANDPRYKNKVLEALGVPPDRWRGPPCVVCSDPWNFRQHHVVTDADSPHKFQPKSEW